jgi:hypothetical protein
MTTNKDGKEEDHSGAEYDRLLSLIAVAERANALACTNKRAAIKLARLTLRSLSGGALNYHFNWGQMAQRTSEELISEFPGIQQLVTWWLEHAKDLELEWTIRLLINLQQVAIELDAFRRNRPNNWREEYFNNIRDKRDLRKQAIKDLESCLLTLDHLHHVLAEDPFRIDRTNEMETLHRFYPAALDLLGELHPQSKEVSLVGAAAMHPKKAERGRITRKLSDALKGVPDKVVNSFVADILDLFWFGTSSTLSNVQSIRRQQIRKPSGRSSKQPI